jgi:hypothetical protein
MATLALSYGLGHTHPHYTPSSTKLVARVNRNFYFTIPSNLGQGYQWKLVDTSIVRIRAHSAKANPHPEASTDLETFTLCAAKRGRVTLSFYLLRPFAPDTAGAKNLIRSILIK